MTHSSILVASDLSERSDRALARAFSIAETTGAHVTLVSVVDEELPPEIARNLADQTRRHLLASQKERAPELPCTIKVDIADPTASLSTMACSDAFDLIVVGRHRPRVMFDRLRPTTVERIVANARIPVLLVADPVHDKYSKVVAPVAFSPACKKAVEAARGLAPDAEFKLFHIWSAPFEGLTRGDPSALARAVEQETADVAREWASKLEVAAPPVELVHGALGQSFQSELRAADPDLVAIGAHTRSLSFTGLGSFAAELVREPPTDLLITRGT